MVKELSILIPTYNDSCTAIVEQISSQAKKIEGLTYEIIIADDGSTIAEIVKENQLLSAVENCKFYRYEKNRGRSAIRNSLVELAQYPWLLFVDGGHMRLALDSYLPTYLNVDESWQVVYGGYCLDKGEEDNLRYRYELSVKQNSSAGIRQKMGNVAFHSSNFMAKKEVFRRVQFDERFVRYGYEDVVMGRDLANEGILVHHIDNPTLFVGYDDNLSFMNKTISALETLKTFHDELKDVSRLARTASLLRRCGVAPIVRKVFSHNRERWLRSLCGSPHADELPIPSKKTCSCSRKTKPSVFIYNLFRLGYYLSNTIE